MKNTEDDVTKIEALLKQGVEHHRELVNNIELTLAFLSGNQWMTAVRNIGLAPVENSTNEYRCTNNMMLPTFHWRMERMFKEQPVITCFAGGDELTDDEKAYVASKLCDYWRSNSGWLNAEKEAAGWVDVSGMSFIAPVWRRNPFLEVKTKKYEYSDEPFEVDKLISHIKEQEINRPDYDVAFDVFSIFNTFLFPLTANKWNKITGILHADIVSYDFLCEHLGEKLTEKDLRTVNPSEINYDALDRVNSYVSGEFALSKPPPEQEKRYLLLTYREKPSFKNRDGRYVVIAGGKKIIDAALPYIKEAREIDPSDEHNISMGVVPWSAMEVPGRLIPPAPMELLRETQVELNDLLTDQKQNRKTVGRNKILIQEDTLDKDAYTDEHGEIIELGKQDTPPVIMQGRTLEGIDSEIAQKRSAFDDLSGRNQLFRGQNPAQVRSAFHLDILREEGAMIIDGETRRREKVHEMVARLCLAICRRRMGREKLIDIVGQDAAGFAVSFLESGNIRFDIRVKEGSALARNHASYEAKLVDMLRAGAFNNPQTGTLDVDLYWRMSKLGTLNFNVDKQAKIRTRARNENHLMYHGNEIIMPQKHEDHYLHIEEHKDFMNRPEWYNAAEEKRVNMTAHLETHTNMLNEQQSPNLFMDKMKPGMIEAAAMPAMKQLATQK
ncbi:MAG: hypothetical protein A2017_06555 [Lentisphaerae bacterium GWF2_44_16]|nr:MAG: hypothetical protein A2017_06555 [Lentisphaerae bacterium GWF2_44_16]